jgi:NAD(P)H-hydrate epimerase
MIAGFLGQGLDAYSAAKIGAWIHGNAGLIAAEKMGNDASVMAGDVADAIPDMYKSTTGIKY